MRHPDLHKFIRKLYRKLKKKLLIRLFGYCYVHGHKWKMQHDGWQANDKCWKTLPSGAEIATAPFTKKKIYYKCKNCPEIAF